MRSLSPVFVFIAHQTCDLSNMKTYVNVLVEDLKILSCDHKHMEKAAKSFFLPYESLLAQWFLKIIMAIQLSCEARIKLIIDSAIQLKLTFI